jgi:sigma-B regulation protein RsbU (phosphoserine phosphatase)
MMLEEMNTDTYFTMIYAELNHMTGHLRMVQAGHPHPALQRADGTVTHLGAGGMPIGVFESPLFDEIDITLGPGDRLLIASDGITEATTPNGRQLGNDGLEAVMRTNAFLNGHSFLESMAWSVSEYCRGERQDDMSAVLVEFRGSGKVIRLDDG